MRILEFQFGPTVWQLGDRPLCMAVVNSTPDSFSDGGRFQRVDDAVRHGAALAAAGADLLDVGGESTRPGAPAVSEKEECERVIPVIRELSRAVDIPISIDTSKASVARAALAAGATIVNDVSALQRDPGMADVLREFRPGCVLMHMRGVPGTMQQHTDYDCVVDDVRAALERALDGAVEASGLPYRHFMLDPGIGFAKTAEQNLELIARIPAFRELGRPVLMGPSRKSFIGKILGDRPVNEREWGTAAAVSACALLGADVVRVHAAATMGDVLTVCAALRPWTCTEPEL